MPKRKPSNLVSKKFLYSSVAITLFAGMFFCLGQYRQQHKTSLPTPTTPFDYEILYTTTGYSPNTLEVPLGSQVAFRNTTDIPMWTASDPHPIHSDFSPFDAHKSYSKNEVYIFRFTESGTFGFHNHEKSIDRGIIRVFDPTHPSQTIDKTKESQRATRDKLLALLKQGDPESVFTLIDTIERDNKLSRDCHDIAHDLGHRAYELFGFSTAMTFSNPHHLSHTSADDICAGGYMHGILEELFLHQPRLQETPGTICASIPTLNRDSCFHGVGHGLMFVHKRNVEESLTDCRRLLDPISVSRCFEGVWMEMFWGNTDHAGASSLGWDMSEPLVPCIQANNDEKPACFLYAHLGYLRNHPRDYTGTVALCVQSNLSPSDVHFCLKGVGITMMKHFTSHHLGETEALVNTISYSEKYAYYQGVIGYARLSGVSDVDILHFCNELKHDTIVCETVVTNVPR